MKYIKRFALIFTALMLTFCLVSCGDSYTAASKKAEPTSSNSASSSTSTKSSGSNVKSNTTNTKPKNLVLVDSGISLKSASSYSDTAYINYCCIVKNPNTSMAATYPTIYATVKDGSVILTTDSQSGFYIMPGDTVALVGTLSVFKNEVTADTSVYFTVDCSDFVNAANTDMVKSSDFKVSNVSEHSGSYSYTVTGEITNNSGKSVDMAYVAVVMTKDGEIVYAENTFVDGIRAGSTKAFELTGYNKFPSHDEVKVYVQEW